MRERKRFLPPGWYPSGAEGVTDAIKAMARSFTRRPPEHGIAGVIPHAGWEFSGGLAFEVMSCLSRSIDTIVIIGGHLGPSDGILCAMEDTFQTPLGSLHADGWLRDTVSRSLALQEDSCADNSVEIQLPFAKYLFPDAGMLWLRAAPSEEAVKLGVALAAAGREGGRCLAIVGSTDLTHYGPNYGFAPLGGGEKARRWVAEVNDRRFIEALVAMDSAAMLDLSRRERSACSAGGAVAAASFAREMGVRKGMLVRYMTSYDVHPAESFVGYAGILYGA